MKTYCILAVSFIAQGTKAPAAEQDNINRVVGRRELCLRTLAHRGFLFHAVGVLLEI